MRKYIEQSIGTIETTIGDLVEALTEVAQEAGSSTNESYELASETLGQILLKNNIEVDV